MQRLERFIRSRLGCSRDRQIYSRPSRGGSKEKALIDRARTLAGQGRMDRSMCWRRQRRQVIDKKNIWRNLKYESNAKKVSSSTASHLTRGSAKHYPRKVDVHHGPSHSLNWLRSRRCRDPHAATNPHSHAEPSCHCRAARGRLLLCM